MRTTKLTKNIEAIGIHGITGQQTEIGTLEAGALIREVEPGIEDDGETLTWTFETSTDGGKSWYKQLTYSAPVTTEAA